eukprot:gene4638-6337_t
MKTIVSHVERADMMAKLWQMGIHFIQGYHVQEPEVVMLGEDLGVNSQGGCSRSPPTEGPRTLYSGIGRKAIGSSVPRIRLTPEVERCALQAGD